MQYTIYCLSSEGVKHLKANQELKRRIKAYLRNNECSITALDLPKKFVKGMLLSDAIEFMDILEREDAYIVKVPLDDTDSDAMHTYFYKYKKKNRGRTLIKLNMKSSAKATESADVLWDLFNTDYLDPGKFLEKEDAKKVQKAINLVTSYRHELEEKNMII